MDCPMCRALVPVDDINLDNMVGKCRQCQNVFRIDPASLAGGPRRSSTDAITSAPARVREIGTEFDLGDDGDVDIGRRDLAPRPERIIESESAIEKQIIKRWFHPSAFFLLAFCIVWDGFLFFWYFMAFAGPNTPWMMVFFPLLHVAVGIGLTYTVICMFLNRTVIATDGLTLSVRNGPIPFWGNSNTPVDDVSYVYCAPPSYQANSAHGLTFSQAAAGVFSLPVDVKLLLAGGKERTFLRAIPRNEGFFIRDRVNAWLGLKPRRIPGEIR